MADLGFQKGEATLTFIDLLCTVKIKEMAHGNNISHSLVKKQALKFFGAKAK